MLSLGGTSRTWWGVGALLVALGGDPIVTADDKASENESSGGGIAGGAFTDECPHCPWTLDDNATVGPGDLANLLAVWGPCPGCFADFNGNNVVGPEDLAAMLANWGPCPPPPNDACASAIALVLPSGPGGGVNSPQYCTYSATTDGPPHGGCTFGGDNQVGSDVWYSVTIPHTGQLVVNTCGAAFSLVNYDSKIAIYGEGADGNTCPNLQNPNLGGALVACNDNGPGCVANSSYISMPVTEGDNYMIRVGGFMGAQGAGELFVVNTPAGDLCVIAIDIPQQAFVTINGTTTDNNQLETQDKSSCATGDTNDEWYRYTAYCLATVTVSTCNAGTNFDTTLAVRANSCLGSEVACNDNLPGCGLNSTVSFVTLPGDVYYIRVAGVNGAVGDFTMTVSTQCVGTP